MIRIFVLVGLIGGLAVAYLTVLAVGPISQLPPPKSLLAEFRVDGFVPASLNLEENPAVEASGVFKVPAQDEVYLDAALKAAGDMGGMDMSASGGTEMPAADSATMPATNSTMNTASADGTMNTASADGTMNTASADGTMNTASADGKTMDMSGASGANAMAGAGGKTMDMGKDGLKISDTGSFDREINLTMSEWKFSDMKIEVKRGERIKFTINNGGQIPHEFMFMSMPLMSAVAYRQTRADWNLLEHEALYEKSLVLPGGKFSFVLEVTKPGTWMFMCMLPYHMEMGMMGQMSTPGATAMQM